MARSYKSICVDDREESSPRFDLSYISLFLSLSVSLSLSLFPRYKSVNRKRPLTPAATRIDVSRCFCAKVKREIYNSFPRLRPIINRCAPLERTSPDRQAGYTCGGGEGVAQLYANYGRNPWSLGIAGLSSAIVAANATAGLSGFAVPRQ